MRMNSGCASGRAEVHARAGPRWTAAVRARYRHPFRFAPLPVFVCCFLLLLNVNSTGPVIVGPPVAGGHLAAASSPVSVSVRWLVRMGFAAHADALLCRRLFHRRRLRIRTKERARVSPASRPLVRDCLIPILLFEHVGL